MAGAQNSKRWFILAIGVLAQACFAIAFAGIPVAGVLMREQYHFSTEELGLILGSMGLGVAFSEIVWGMLTDKFGDKVVLLIGLFGMGTVFLILGIFFGPNASSSDRTIPIALLLVAAGFIGGSINSSSGRAVMTWFQDHERGLAMSIRQTAIPVGGALGSFLVPMAASYGGFAHAYLLLTLLFYVTVAAVYFGLPSKEHAQHGQSSAPAGVSPLLRWDVWRVALVSGLLTVPQFSVLTFGTIYLHDARLLSYKLSAAILIIIQLGGAVLRIYMGRYTDKRKNRPATILLISIIAAISAFILAAMANQEIITVVCLLIIVGLAGHAWHGIAYTEAAVLAGVSRAGTALGMVGMTVFVAAFLTPIAIPYLLHFGSWSLVWSGVGLASAFGVVLISPIFGKRKHP
ncbi:MFS transporter [Acetobacteraceae bacterium ESL0697]|nr:MFS transporter [Acetobacteraceae bacterium ESL0697]